ncbi:MAG: carboxypeptidase-like regulatory domain-containing protein [Erythrobacter sp.]|uniref:carboxypeptidase-like regulatory domain-containing protein n=1 Tax=Erythrobacter sp. TaxID=1042 RepID=UPI002615094F|nr:carboxypeptidase-like regulatory domain-containing protein [Erythrobacter sp.]MDJ0978465.1 carboxypeptidase-like regulatory domain-containing protein [Erythrobacter sp.]
MFFHRHRFRNVAASIAATLSAFAMIAPVSAQAQDATVSPPPTWEASEDDFLLLQLRIKQYKLTFDVRGYRTNQGVCLDLADVIQSLDLPIRIDKKSRRATGWLFAEDQSFTIDLDSDMVQSVNSSGSNARGPIGDDIYQTPEGWCADTKALSQWFGIAFKPDLYNSIVLLESEESLPFMQAIERRSRAARLQKRRPATFDLSKYPTADMEYKPWRTPSVDIVARAGTRTGGLGGDQTTANVEIFASGEALGASYNARFATDETMRPQSLRLRAYRNDPQGELLGPLKATEVAVGDVETLAGQLTGQTAIGRGAFVTNRPLGRPARFSQTSLRGVLPTGWDAELYRNGQLIAFQDDRGDGRYEFLDIDLFFGRNDLEVVLYGPQGQIRRERSTIPVGLNQIEPGQTYYWAGVVQNDRDLIELDDEAVTSPQRWRWGVGVERGLDQRTSAAIGAQSLFFAGKRRTYAEGALARTIGSLQFELAGAHEFGAGSVTELNALGRLGKFNFGADVTVAFGNFQSEFVDGEIDHRVGFNFDTSLRLGRLAVPVQGSVSRLRLRDGSKVNQILTTASITAGRLALSAQIDHQSEVAGGASGGGEGPGRDDTRFRLLANTRFRDVRLRGNATFLVDGPDAGLETVDVRMDMDLDERSELQGQLEYASVNDEFRLTAGYTRRFDQLSLRGNGFVTSLGGVGANVQLAFSLGPDPVSGGVRVTQTKLARSGQAAVTVFRDEDGDGQRDPDEELLKDVLVEAGLRRTNAVTGENGRTIVDDLNPFQPVLVGVDESSLGDPFLAPAIKGVVVTPRPGVIAKIELPISPSGEIEGLLLNPSGLEQPGVKLELINKDGAVTAATISEFDGFFLFERVPYGRYSLRVAEHAAKTLQVAPNLPGSEGADSVEVKRGSDLVRLGAVKLTPLANEMSNNPRDGPKEEERPPKVAAIQPRETSD